MAAVEQSTSARKRTHNHDKIRRWVESRGGTPAVVERTWDGHRGELSIDFGSGDAELAEISWDDFFRILDEQSLDFEYQEGSDSRFYTFVSR